MMQSSNNQLGGQIAQNVNFNMLINPQVNQLNQMTPNTPIPPPYDYTQSQQQQPKQLKAPVCQSQPQMPLTSIFQAQNEFQESKAAQEQAPANEIFQSKEIITTKKKTAPGQDQKVNGQQAVTNDETTHTMNNSLGIIGSVDKLSTPNQDDTNDSSYDEKSCKAKVKKVRKRKDKLFSKRTCHEEKLSKNMVKAPKEKVNKSQVEDKSNSPAKKKQKGALMMSINHQTPASKPSLTQKPVVTALASLSEMQGSESSTGLMVHNKLTPAQNQGEMSTKSKTPDTRNMREFGDDILSQNQSLLGEQEKKQIEQQFNPMSDMRKLSKQQLLELNKKVQKRFNAVEARINKTQQAPAKTLLPGQSRLAPVTVRKESAHGVKESFNGLLKTKTQSSLQNFSLKKRDNFVRIENEDGEFVSTRRNVGELQDDDPFNQEGLGVTEPLDDSIMKKLQQRMRDITKNMPNETEQKKQDFVEEPIFEEPEEQKTEIVDMEMQIQKSQSIKKIINAIPEPQKSHTVIRVNKEPSTQKQAPSPPQEEFIEAEPTNISAPTHEIPPSDHDYAEVIKPNEVLNSEQPVQTVGESSSVAQSLEKVKKAQLTAGQTKALEKQLKKEAKRKKKKELKELQKLQRRSKTPQKSQPPSIISIVSSVAHTAGNTSAQKLDSKEISSQKNLPEDVQIEPENPKTVEKPDLDSEIFKEIQKDSKTRLTRSKAREVQGLREAKKVSYVENSTTEETLSANDNTEENAESPFKQDATESSASIKIQIGPDSKKRSVSKKLKSKDNYDWKKYEMSSQMNQSDKSSQISRNKKSEKSSKKENDSDYSPSKSDKIQSPEKQSPSTQSSIVFVSKTQAPVEKPAPPVNQAKTQATLQVSPNKQKKHIISLSTTIEKKRPDKSKSKERSIQPRERVQDQRIQSMDKSQKPKQVKIADIEFKKDQSVFREKNKRLHGRAIQEYNANEFEHIYEDGVETTRRNEGYHPSGRAYYRWDEKMIDDCLAWWTKADVIRDKYGRRPDDPNYDKHTLFVPEEAWKDLSPSMIQYWRLKVNHYSKIFFFRLGKFYEIYYDDAVLCNRILDLHWMSPDKKLHTGFPEKKLNKYISLLVTKGYTVAIIEPTETCREALQRNIETKANLTHEKIMNMSFDERLDQKQGLVSRRVIHQIFTKGTFNDTDKDSFEPQFVMAIARNDADGKNNIGVCYFDLSTFKCFIGSFVDNENSSTLRTCIAKIRPLEVVYDPLQITKDIEKMLKNLPVQPVINLIPPERIKSVHRCQNAIDKYLYSAEDEQKGEINKQHKHIFDIRWKPECLTSVLAFGNAVTFLEQQMLQNQSLKFFEYLPFDAGSDLTQNPFMIMDSQAIENLEIAECIVNGYPTAEGSLLQWVDHTKTLFGKRGIRKWLLSPLICPNKINERLDAVEEIMRFPANRNAFRERLANLPDLEKILAKVFVYSVKSTFKAVSFENVQFQKLKEFKILLQNFRSMMSILYPLRQKKDKIRSRRLLRLITLTSEADYGMVPDMEEAIKELDYLVVWKRVTGLYGVPGGVDDIPEPRRGIDETFDEANDRVTQCKERMQQYVDSLKERFRPKLQDKIRPLLKQIKFVHARYRYEIEVPNLVVKHLPSLEDLVLTSQKAGFQRFHTDKLKEMMEQLEEREEDLKDAITPFVCAIFQRFYENRKLWQPAVQILIELDCLQSLACASSQDSETKMCRPVIVPDLDKDGKQIRRPFLDLVNMQHPGVKMQNFKKKVKKIFVPNSTNLSTKHEPARALLVTGPNMGGKSTLLRQTCLAVILAQMGCFVPAERFTFTPCDRIFTRLGASDRILEGKSTFFVEMEETKNILSQGTNRSLAILDELGRGTSTFDGYSIANSVLSNIVRGIKCRCLFATHYHMLLDDYRNCPGVSSYFMACKQDEKHPDKIEFLYKFKKGECPQSFGMNVALMSGLDKKIVEYAKVKSQEFDKKMKDLSKNCVARNFHKELYKPQTWSQVSSQQSLFNPNYSQNDGGVPIDERFLEKDKLVGLGDENQEDIGKTGLLNESLNETIIEGTNEKISQISKAVAENQISSK